MPTQELERQLPYATAILAAFLFYGLLVRRGTISGKGILGYGILVGVFAVAASVVESLPQWRAGMPLPVLLLNPLMMTVVTVFCVALTYQTQKVEDLSTHTVGDTKIIVRVCLPMRMPDAHALLLPTATDMRLIGGLAGPVGSAVGAEVEKLATARAPVGIGKVVETTGGKLAVGHIYHVAVQEPFKSVAATTLKRGIETAAQQARKHGAESVIVPLGPLRGLTPIQSMQPMVEGILRHRKAFGEIVFVAFDGRTGKLADEVVRRAVETIAAGPTGSAAGADHRSHEGK